jgi:hypothetical protein
MKMKNVFGSPHRSGKSGTYKGQKVINERSSPGLRNFPTKPAGMKPPRLSSLNVAPHPPKAPGFPGQGVGIQKPMSKVGTQSPIPKNNTGKSGAGPKYRGGRYINGEY